MIWTVQSCVSGRLWCGFRGIYPAALSRLITGILRKTAIVLQSLFFWYWPSRHVSARWSGKALAAFVQRAASGANHGSEFRHAGGPNAPGYD